MSYKEFLPEKKLEHIIDKLWIFDNKKKETTSRILPDCSMDIIFNFGNAFYSGHYSSKINNNDIIITGMMTDFLDLSYDSDIKLFGIRFKPLGINYFLNIDFNNIKNDSIRLEHIFSSYYYSLLKNIFFFENPEDIINYFQKTLLQILDVYNYSIDSDVVQAVTKIYRQPNIPIQSVIKDIHITQRQLEIKFKRDIGINMKEFSNINRFINTRKEILLSKKNLTEIALDNGYYDSSHFIKEIKKYSGLSPKKLK